MAKRPGLPWKSTGSRFFGFSQPVDLYAKPPFIKESLLSSRLVGRPIQLPFLPFLPLKIQKLTSTYEIFPCVCWIRMFRRFDAAEFVNPKSFGFYNVRSVVKILWILFSVDRRWKGAKILSAVTNHPYSKKLLHQAVYLHVHSRRPRKWTSLSPIGFREPRSIASTVTQKETKLHVRIEHGMGRFQHWTKSSCTHVQKGRRYHEKRRRRGLKRDDAAKEREEGKGE